MNMKGLSSFMRQGIYLIALFFFLAIVSVSLTSYSEKTYKAGERAMKTEKATELMDTMVEKCFNGTINQSKIEFYAHNPEKLRDCARTYDFEYWVEFVIREQEWKDVEGSSPGRKRYIVLVMDTSGSMDTAIAGRKRMEIAKEGIEEFLRKCSSPDDRFSIITYDASSPPGECDRDRYLKVEGDLMGSSEALSKIGSLFSRHSNTPIFASVRKAISLANAKSGFDEKRVIVFTDGGDTCIRDYGEFNNDICMDNANMAPMTERRERMEQLAEKYRSRVASRLPPFDGKIYTVGFALTDKCTYIGAGDVNVGDVYGRVLLMSIAKEYGGKYYEVYSSKDVRDAFCKSLESLSTPPKTERRVWEIGKIEMDSMVVSKNIIIHNSTGSYPSLMKLHILDTPEVMLAKRIELACSGIDSYFEGMISDFEIRDDGYCFDGICIPRECKLEIEPSTINAGKRKLFIRKEGERVRII